MSASSLSDEPSSDASEGSARGRTEVVTIQKSWSWLTALSVEIECDPTLPPRVKLGLAVKVAYKGGADLSGAVLRGAVLRGADLSGADLSGADLRDAVLSGAVLSGADLRDAVLSGADLSGAVLSGADLSGAVLRGAVLRGADLSGAVLSGADLRDAVLSGEKITGIFASVNRLDGFTFYGAGLVAGGYKIAAGCRWFTTDQYRAHVAEKYPDTAKARETLAIIAFIEARAAVAASPVEEAA